MNKKPSISVPSSTCLFVNGDASWELPIPATYIIERDGTVLYAYANEDYTERPEPENIVRFLANPSGA